MYSRMAHLRCDAMLILLFIGALAKLIHLAPLSEDARLSHQRRESPKHLTGSSINSRCASLSDGWIAAERAKHNSGPLGGH